MGELLNGLQKKVRQEKITEAISEDRLKDAQKKHLKPPNARGDQTLDWFQEMIGYKE